MPEYQDDNASGSWGRNLQRASAWCSRSWAATINGWNQALLSTTGAVAEWHEQLKLRAERPELAEHLGIREEAVRLAEKLSRMGYAHPKAQEMMMVGSTVLMVLMQSMPADVSDDERAKTLTASEALKYEVQRLGEGRR
jgi:hypothetical protein